jgi:hypothetical protein
VARPAPATAALARRFGATVPAVEAEPERARSLSALAVENAREGCAGESFGAAVALWQSRTAGDDRIRRAMRAIAADELRHAELAWAIDRWVRPRLDLATRRRLDAQRGDALRALTNQPPADEELVRVAGVPDARAARTLIAGLRRWS